MHFDPTIPVLIPALMFEARHMKVSSEFSVNPGEDVQIESRGDPRRIIVGRQHLVHRFVYVGTQQQGVTGLQLPADVAQEPLGCRWIEIADAAAEEQHQQRLVR